MVVEVRGRERKCHRFRLEEEEMVSIEKRKEKKSQSGSQGKQERFE